MPATDLISPFVVSCAGGLTLNKDVFSMQPGEALILQNFEPDIKGGYRRVSGTAQYNTTIVPEGSSNSSLVVDCSIIFNGQIIVARGGDIHRGTTSGSWTSLTTGLGTSTRAYDFEKFKICSFIFEKLFLDITNIFDLILITWSGVTGPLLT